MTEVLKGTVSTNEGLREALEIVNTLKTVNSGVLEIRSEQVSGRIGIAWGRYITGALLTSQESGRPALRQLLMLKSGTFSFIDTDGEPIAELRQGLGIDLNGVFPYVPDKLTVAVTPWLFDVDEQAAELYGAADKSPGASPPVPEPAPTQNADEVDATVIRQARKEAATFLSEETISASHLQVDTVEKEQTLQEDLACVETFQSCPSIDLPEGYAVGASPPVAADRQALPPVVEPVPTRVEPPPLPVQQPEVQPVTPPAHEMIRQLFEAPTVEEQPEAAAPNALPPPQPWSDLAPPLPVRTPTPPPDDRPPFATLAEPISSISLPGSSFVNQHGQPDAIRPLDIRQRGITGSSLMTPEGAFQVFDPGTAPEDVFVKRRAQTEPVPPRPAERAHAPVQAVELPPPRRGPMIPSDAYKDPSEYEAQDETGTVRLARRFSRDTQGTGMDARAICILVFVISFAGTILLGPRVIDMINMALHTTH